MKAVLDRLAWVHEDNFDHRSLVRLLRGDLTVMPMEKSGFAGGSDPFPVYEKHGKLIGIPRHFLLNKYPDAEILDKTIFPIGEKFPTFKGELRPYQQVAVDRFLNEVDSYNPYGGLLEAACGTGKTVTSLNIASKLKSPTVVLVHESGLLHQWAGEINNFLGVEAGIVQRDKQTFNRSPITVAMFQTVKSRQTQLRTNGFFDRFGTMIVDESHHVGAKTYEAVLRQFPTKVRIGLSATFRRKDGLECLYHWHIGKKLVKMVGKAVTGRYAIVPWKHDKTQLNRMKTILKYKGIAGLVTALAEDPARNHFIANEVLKAYRAGRKPLVLSQRRKQLDELEKIIRKKMLLDGDTASIGQYVGGMSEEELERTKKRSIILGTYNKFAEGTDIPSLDTLFLATPMSDVEQAVGRIQRICEGKKEPLIVDLVDEIGICIGMSKKRMKIYFSLKFTRS